MGAAFTATLAIPGQTITGSGGIDVLRSSTGTDTLTGGAGNDTLHASVKADTIDGGAGTDTYVTATTQVAASIEGAGTGTSTGVVVNLGSTAISNSAVLVGPSTQNLAGTLAAVPTNSVAYVYNGAASTNSAVMDTLVSIENVTLAGNGKNYVVGSDAANTITGGSGEDYINGGKGNDIIIVGADALATAADQYIGGAGTGDELRITAAAGTAVIDDSTGIELITVVPAGAADITINLTATNASTQAYVINAATLTNASAVFTLGASDAQVDGTITVTGGAGNDIIVTGDGAANVTGGGGNDAITLDAGTNTVNIPFGGAGVDTITAFIGGTDILDLTGTSDVNDAAGSDLDLDGFLIYDTAANYTLVEGLTVFGGLTLTAAVDAGATLTAAEIETFLADTINGGLATKVSVGTAADVAYVIIEGAAGASTLAKVTGGADTTIDLADITILAHFGALDSNTLTAANFSDFIT